MKPRTPAIVAAGLFVVTAVIAIVLVSTSGGEKARHHHGDDEADLDPPVPILLDQQRAAMQARPEVTIEVHADHFTVVATGVASPVFEEIQADGSSVDATAKLRETLEKVHADVGGDASVRVVPDPDVQHMVVVDAMESAKMAGFERLSIKTP